MTPEIAGKLEAIQALCRRFEVRSLFLFGSAVGGEFDADHSDVDFVVEFQPGVSGGFKHPYFQLQESLEQLLGRRVDLVAARAITNPYFAAAVNATKVPVYAAA